MSKEQFKSDLDNLLKVKPNVTVQKVVQKQLKKPKEDSKQVSFYIEKSLLIQLKMKALENNHTLKQAMTAAVLKYLEQDQ